MPTSLLLFLTGYRGSGKSTVAPLIAELVDGDWVDTDDLIELSAEKPISQIFAEDGEAEFRRMEHDAIRAVAGPTNDGSPLIVSLGGGAITFENNRDLIGTSKTVYLRGSVDTLWQRINTDPVSGDKRPNLTDQGGRAEVEEILEARREIYEAASSDFQIDIDELTPAEIAEQS